MTRFRFARFARLSLAAAAGVGLACWVIPIRAAKDGDGTLASSTTTAKRRAPLESRSLGSDAQLIKFAAMAGRFPEARAKLKVALADGATDEELVEWLAPLLIADGGWLDEFIESVPEDRRISLIRLTIEKMALLQPDSVWELVRRSSAALAAARTREKGQTSSGMDLLGRVRDSPLAAEVMFDPALSFSDAEIERYFNTGSSDLANTHRLLDEWQRGRWQGQTPACISSSWSWLRGLDPAGAGEMKKNAQGEYADVLAKFEEERTLYTRTSDPGRDAAPEDLKTMSAQQIADYNRGRVLDGRPLPLETVAGLPPGQRAEVLVDYMSSMYPFNGDIAESAVEHLDAYGFSPVEKEALLKDASLAEWQNRGDIDTVMNWLSRLPEGQAKRDVTRKVLEDFAASDPEGALKLATGMVPGETREELEANANKALR